MENRVATPGRLHYGWIVVAMGTMVVFASLGLARFGYTVVLPSMQTSLDFNNTEAGFLATANLVGYLLLAVIGGALASRLGPRIVITAGLALAGVSMIFTGLSESFLPAVVWRALTGIGSAASNVPVMGLLSAWFTARRRGLATGIAVTGSSIALIAIGTFIPSILEADRIGGWRIAWFIFGGLALALALSGFIILRNRPSDKGLLPIGADVAPAPAAGKAAGGLEWGKVYRSLSVWYLGLVYTCFGFSYIIYMTFFSKHLLITGKFSTIEAGHLFKLMGFCALFCGVLWGSVSDRIGRRKALAIVFLIQAVSFSMFGLWPVLPGLVISAVLFGFTAWSIPGIMAAACGDTLGPRLAPAALGFITLMFSIGQASGTSIAGIIADKTGSFGPAFVLAGGIAFLGAVGSLFYRPKHD